MDMWWESQSRCFRGLKDRWNAQSVLDGELTSSDGALANQVRTRALPGRDSSSRAIYFIARILRADRIRHTEMRALRRRNGGNR